MSPQVFFIDFGQSTLDPTPAECEEELLQLRSVMSGSPGSGGWMRPHGRELGVCRMLCASLRLPP